MAAEQTTSQTGDAASETRKLSASDRVALGELGEVMNYYHNHFRHTWTQIYANCSGTAPSPLSAARLVRLGQQFIAGITMHPRYRREYAISRARSKDACVSRGRGSRETASGDSCWA